MTPDPEAFAALLCDYCLEVAPGQQVVVRSTSLASPLLLALQRAVLEREAWPFLPTANGCAFLAPRKSFSILWSNARSRSKTVWP